MRNIKTTEETDPDRRRLLGAAADGHCCCERL